MSNVTDFHQFIDPLPAPLTIQIALLRKWCVYHNWSNFQVTHEFNFCATPPGGTRQILLPEDALAQLKHHEDLLDTLHQARTYQQDFRKGRQHLITGLLLSLPCFGVSILTNTNFVTNVPTALIVPREIRAEFNLLTAGVAGIWLVIALVTLLKYWKYRSLKNKFAMLSYEFFKP